MNYTASTIHRWVAPLAALLVMLVPGQAPAATPGGPLTRARFHLRTECTCASCGFDLQGRLRKLPGVQQVELSIRDRCVTVAVDESRSPLSRLAAVMETCELGKHSALIGDLTDAQPAAETAARAHVSGVRAAQVDAKKHHLLLELSPDPPMTTADLAAAMAKAGITVRFDTPAGPRSRASR